MTPDAILLVQADVPDLDAGEFSDWLEGMDRALRGHAESNVPCGDCNACCRSRYFIELRPDDVGARRRIPAALIFDAPGAPAGYKVLGYDEHGQCPMLVSRICSIYGDRPGTCRTYDCRMFAATGLAEPGSDRADVTARAARWRFSYRDDASRDRHRLLQTGARRLLEMLREDVVAGPGNASQLAMLAVRLFPVFTDLAGHLEADNEADADRVKERIRSALAALRSRER